MSKLLLALVALIVPSRASSYDGPWYVGEKLETQHYDVYSIQHDTVTSATESVLAPDYYQKEQAQDMAQALNDAHERRVNSSIVHPPYVILDRPVIAIPCFNGENRDLCGPVREIVK